MMVWVLIAVLAGPNYTETVTNLGAYASREDCESVIAAVRQVQDIRPSRFRCVPVQKVAD